MTRAARRPAGDGPDRPAPAPAATVLRRGDRGEAVRDLQQRLGALGLPVEPDEAGAFADATEAAVRTFQRDRGLQIDGEVGRATWTALVDSGFSLGDRLLYFRQPLQRGDDVAALQRRLNTLGFDARRVDGLFGIDTHRALLDFQRSIGLAPDAICGPSTINALDRVGQMAAGSVASARERDALRHGAPGLEGRRIFVATTPGLTVIGKGVVRALAAARAIAVCDSSGHDESVVARAANVFGADLFLGLSVAKEPGPRCAYFATEGFRSELGHLAATCLSDALTPQLGAVSVVGRAYPVLRETRMAAVVVELVGEGDAPALAAIVRRSGAVTRGVVTGVRRAWNDVGRDDAGNDDLGNDDLGSEADRD
ncbi:MAG: N-acetylmuramoyl-L-alanine amidase [Acidimicrobiia bacterium]